MIPLDGKVSGVLVSNNTGQVIPPDEYVVFRVHDKHLLRTLKFYKDLCSVECGMEQILAVERLMDRVCKWQNSNPDKMKLPDAEPGECH